MTEQPRILVVEDDPNFANSLQMLLERELAAEVVVAGDGARVRDVLASSIFDLITLAHQLPDSDGIELLEEIRSKDQHTPVVLITGQGDEATAARAFKAGAAGYLVKDSGLPWMLPSVLGKALDTVRFENSLRDSEIRYRRLFEAAEDGILILDATTGTIADVNPFLIDLLGYSREEILGKNLWEIGAFEDVAQSKELFATLQEKKYVRYEHLPLESKDGHRVDVEFVSNVYDADYERVIQCNIRDITKRKQTEDTLRETREYLESLFNKANAPIIVWNPGRKITRFNHAFERISGLSSDEVIGKDLEMLFPSESKEESLKKIDRVLTGESWESMEVPILTGEGQVRIALWNSANIYGADGKTVVATIAQGQDITERKQAEQDLKRINVELEGFAHTVSHDLKGPMSSVGMSLALLRELLRGQQSEEARSETRDVVDLMGRSVGKADELIGALLRLAEAGQIPEDVVSIDVGQVVKTVFEERSGDLETNGITVDYDGELGRVLGDYYQIYQLFSNLISNAITHNDSQSPMIEIMSLENDVPGGHRYLVRDNGSGIPEEDLQRVFEPFFKGTGGRTGIGLSTVDRLVKIYSGEIIAYNDDGACFEFTLKDWLPKPSDS